MLLVILDELIPADHLCWVIEAFVNRLETGFRTLGTGGDRAAGL